jgi:hypothetical protein
MSNTAQRWTSALLTVLAVGITDASFVIHAQQCPPGSNIVIDPRLMPKRTHISSDQLAAVLNSPVSQEIKNQYWRMYMEQNQPIQMPFRNGYVLIDPNNLCHQQFIPLQAE